MIQIHEPWSLYERRVASLQRRIGRWNFAVGVMAGLGLAIAIMGGLMLANILRF